MLVRQFANIVSVALDNALLYDEQRSISEELQRAFLPTALPESERFVLDAIYKPNGGGPEYMGGDWYDAFMLPDGALALSIGDVTGHCVYAAVQRRHHQRIILHPHRDLNPIAIPTSRLHAGRSAATCVTLNT
jgi:sigma-B regulation protein RsbU (phosphoserine phosphatase)